MDLGRARATVNLDGEVRTAELCAQERHALAESPKSAITSLRSSSCNATPPRSREHSTNAAQHTEHNEGPLKLMTVALMTVAFEAGPIGLEIAVDTDADADTKEGKKGGLPGLHVKTAVGVAALAGVQVGSAVVKVLLET